MKRVVTGVFGIAAAATMLVGCSDDSGSDPATGTESSSAASPQATTGGSTEVTVDGADLAGLDLDSVTCVKQGGKINVGSGAIGGQQGLGIVMTDATPPVVESLGMVVDGNALAVTNTMGAKVGSAEVSVDGETYTITGEASGADISNPMGGMITKPFTVTVTCN